MTEPNKSVFLKFGASRFNLDEFYGFKAINEVDASTPYRIHLYKKGDFHSVNDSIIKLFYIKSKKETWEKLVEMLDAYFNVAEEIISL